MTEKLSAFKFGLAGGIITAICIFVMTISALVLPSYAPDYSSLLIQIYGFLGYRISIFGAFLGAVYSFIDGFVLTWIFALIYNKLLR